MKREGQTNFDIKVLEPPKGFGVSAEIAKHQQEEIDRVEKKLSKIKILSLGNAETNKILLRAIQLGRAELVMEIVKKIDTKKINLIDHITYNLLLKLINSGHSDEVADLISKIDIKNIKLDVEQTYNFLVKMIETGHADKVIKIISKININSIDPTDPYTYNILTLLYRLGQDKQIKAMVDKIMTNILEGHVDLNDNKTYDLLLSIARLGQQDKIIKITDQIVSKINPQEIDLFDHHTYDFLIRLSNLGQDKKVTEITSHIVNDINSENVDLRGENEKTLLMERLAEFGHVEQINEIAAISANKIDLSEPDVTNFFTWFTLVRLAKLGMAEKILNIVIDNKFNLSDDQTLHLLSKLAELGQTDKITKLIENNLNSVSPKVLEFCLTSLRTTHIGKIMGERDLPKNIELFLNNLSLPELQFLRMILAKHHSFLHPEIVQLIEGLEKGRQFVAQIDKTGSDLFVVGGDKESHTGHRNTRPIVFMHRINQSASDAWQKSANSDIPTAPITGNVLTYGEKKDQVVVPSRYCGLTINEYNQMFFEFPEFKKFLFLLDIKFNKSINELGKIDITHGHPHPNNGTVEFVKKGWLEKQKANGKNINTIPYDPDNISFNPEDYFKNPSDYEIVVRVIDFDQAYIEE